MIFDILTCKIKLFSWISIQKARSYLHRNVTEADVPENGNDEKQLLVDVSEIFQKDSRTGIQRVVRSILLHLHKYPPDGYRVRPVFASRKQKYSYAPKSFGQTYPHQLYNNDSSIVHVNSGDVFLGLDLTAHLLPLHIDQLIQWKCNGVKIHVLVYDLLPVMYPDWFNPKSSKNFKAWLKTLAITADSLICISNSVKTELECWLNKKYSLPSGMIPVSKITLGADIVSSVPSKGMPRNVKKLKETLSGNLTVLMVGTIEPRKGHGFVLDAFEKLWRRDFNINLILVGKRGWKTEELQQRIITHPKNQISLFWFDNASDELLDMLYQDCTGVIVASQAEGFGLPLIEAGYHNKPVLARDIPVLREIGGDFATFFSGNETESLDMEIENWLSGIANGREQKSFQPLNWQASANELLIRLGLNKETRGNSDMKRTVQVSVQERTA